MSSFFPRSAVARAVAEDESQRLRRLVCQCDGFRVWGAAGKLGVVERVLVDGWEEPRSLVVCNGLFRLRRFLVPASAITTVDVQRRCVLVADGVGVDPFRGTG